MFPRLALFLRAFLLRAFFLHSIVIALVLIAAATLVFAQSQDANPKNKSPQRPSERAGVASDVARGKYLVEGVAICGECHTPQDNDGNPDRARWLQGATVPWLPAKPDANWPINAPRIGGTPPASDADMIKLLTTGIWTNGNRLRSPMPQFRMERSDAEAVVAYLKSVAPQQ